MQLLLLLINHDNQGGGEAVAGSGCKRINNDQNQYFLDLTVTNYDICSFVRVGISFTYLYFWPICDTGKIHEPGDPSNWG